MAEPGEIQRSCESVGNGGRRPFPCEVALDDREDPQGRSAFIPSTRFIHFGSTFILVAFVTPRPFIRVAVVQGQ